MGLDVLLLRNKAPFSGWNELSEDNLLPFSRKRTYDSLQAVYPDIEWNGGQVFLMNNGEASVEFQFGKEEEATSFSMEIHVAQDTMAAVEKICQALRCNAFTFEGEPLTAQYCQTYSEWFDKAMQDAAPQSKDKRPSGKE